MKYLHNAKGRTFGLTLLLLSALALLGAYPANADGAGNTDTAVNGCMQDVAGFGLNCTANDIEIAGVADDGFGNPDITILDDGCAFPGDTVTFTATFEVLLTAQARHDIGLWFRIDGGPDALVADPDEDDCIVGTPAYAPDPPWLDLDGTGDTFLDTNVVSNIQDTCGDIDDDHNPLYPVMTVTAMCVAGPDGNLALPNCTSWKQPGDNDLCTSPLPVPGVGGEGLDSSGVPPGAPSKCKCDVGFTVPIRVPAFITVDKVALDPNGDPLPGDPTLFDFSITGPTVGPANPDLPDNFQLADADPIHSSPPLVATDENDNVVGPYQVTETLDPAWTTTASCTRDNATPNDPNDDTTFTYTNGGDIQPLPGEVVACTFTNTLQDPCFSVDCSELDDQCNDGVCNPDTGECEAKPKANSTPCEDGYVCTSETGTPQTPDHCYEGVCTGVPVDCSELDDQCNDGVCNPDSGACEAKPKANSTPCEDGYVCTSETGTPQTPDHCYEGVCTGVPVDCSELDDQCNDGVCNPDSGACEAKPKANSTPCEDGYVCTSETGTPQTPDHCYEGVCTGVPVDCSELDDQCNDGVCNPDSGACEAKPKANSTPCEDGYVCTSETGTPQTPDHCYEGVCTGVPVDCSELDDQCNDGVCNPDSGACEAKPKANSTPCEDGYVCTSETGTPQTPDHCYEGVCTGVPVDCSELDDQCNDGVCNPDSGACEAKPKANSTPCEDGYVCTSETGTPQTPDHCYEGVCTGVPVDCSELDDQCNDGVCNPDSGACEAKPKANSTPCEDGYVCTSETGTPQTPDHCYEGVCTGVPVDCSELDDQCNDGVCNPDSGACEAKPKANSTPCEDGYVCTSETGTPQTPDHCYEGVCTGVPVDCSELDDQCNDGVCNPDSGACEAKPKANSTPCEDGYVCTSETGTPQTPDHCYEGVCTGVPVDCGPGDQCNDNVCNEYTGECVLVPKADSTPCDDGYACTSETGTPRTPDHCFGGVCTGVPVNCNDDNVCTDDSCDPATGWCINDPTGNEGQPCDDGDACTSSDTCTSALCVGIPADCDDGNQCTDDSCDPATGQCINDPTANEGQPCDDGDACTSSDGTPGGGDVCTSALCLGRPVECEPGDQCNPDTGFCEGEPTCELDWNCDGVVDFSDLYDTANGGFYQDWRLYDAYHDHPVYGPYVEGGWYHKQHCGQPGNLDWDGNGVIEYRDGYGGKPASTNLNTFYTQYWVYVNYPQYYDYYYPDSNCE